MFRMDVAYVAMVVHVYCKRLFSMFHFFHMYVVSVFIWILYMFSHICCKCFYLDVVYICNGFQAFSGVSTSFCVVPAAVAGGGAMGRARRGWG